MSVLIFKLRENFEDAKQKVQIPRGIIVYGTDELTKETTGGIEFTFRRVSRYVPGDETELYKNVFHNIPTGMLECISNNNK